LKINLRQFFFDVSLKYEHRKGLYQADFGLKLKQARTNKNLSLFGLAKITDLSKSYLNEIEKEKSIPKQIKSFCFLKLEVSYDSMVSLKLDNNLAPIGEILKSGILKEIPLDLLAYRKMI
jgi:transcriptional regulator with XRE-family HTH domain